MNYPTNQQRTAWATDSIMQRPRKVTTANAYENF